MRLEFLHKETNEVFEPLTAVVILATSNGYTIPEFLEPIKSQIIWSDGKYDFHRNYVINNNNTLYVQNAEFRTHGFNRVDLGMGPYRNAIILNSILGYEHFVMEKNVAFQRFGGIRC